MFCSTTTTYFDEIRFIDMAENGNFWFLIKWWSLKSIEDQIREQFQIKE